MYALVFGCLTFALFRLQTFARFAPLYPFRNCGAVCPYSLFQKLPDYKF